MVHTEVQSKRHQDIPKGWPQGIAFQNFNNLKASFCIQQDSFMASLTALDIRYQKLRACKTGLKRWRESSALKFSTVAHGRHAEPLPSILLLLDQITDVR